MNTWLRTDEYEEIVTTLKSCQKFLKETDNDLSYWKWVFISLHNALQGCMVVALTGSDSFGAINEDQERKWRKAYSENSELPKEKEKLLRFLDLYKKIKKKGNLTYSTIESFKPEGTQGRSIKKLSEIRDEFIHFTPKGWSLNLSGASDICIDCLNIALVLINNCGKFSLFLSYKENELVDLIDCMKDSFMEKR